MSKKIYISLFIVISLITVFGIYETLNQSTTEEVIVPINTINYLMSSEDTTKYCNGENMDSVGYQKTIIISKSISTREMNPTKLDIIKETINVATTGMCNSVMNQLDIREKDGTVYIPEFDVWAGVSIVMCYCKPQVEVNLLQIPGITNIVWSKAVNNFEDCVSTGSPVMESYPRQCKYGDKNFVEDVGNVLEKINLIKLENPLPNQIIISPLSIKGSARGSWFFEASFPVFLVDWDGRIISQGIANAKSDWMTNEFVPFEATLNFILDKNVYSNRGALILKKDNPSGLPKNDDALEIPIVFATGSSAIACTLEAKLCPDGSYVSRAGENCEFARCP